MKALIFDLDGTLADTLPLCFAGFQHVFQRFLGENYTDAEVRAMFGPSEEGVFQRRMPTQWEDALAVYLAFYAREHDRFVRPIPGVERLLQWLQERRCRVAIVTAKGPRSAAITLERLGLTRYVDDVRAGSAAGNLKAARIGEVLAEWDLPPGEVAYVGDAPSDVRAAREAGTVAIGAAWVDGADPAMLRSTGAAAAFTSPEDLRVWLRDSHAD